MMFPEHKLVPNIALTLAATTVTAIIIKFLSFSCESYALYFRIFL